MPIDAPARFQARLSALSGAELEAFVAALWEARGYAVERVENGLLVRQSSDDSTTKLAVLQASYEGAAPPDVDMVVAIQASAPAVGSEVTVIDVDELFEMSVFGVETAESDRLWTNQLNISPPEWHDAVDAGTGAASEAGGDQEPAADELETRNQTTEDSAEAADVEKTTSVASQARESAPGIGGTTDRASDSGGRFSRRGTLIAGAAALAGLGTAAAVSMSTNENVEIPVSGLDRDGVQDPGALAETHGTVIEGTSYSLALRSLWSEVGGGLRSYLSLDLGVTRDRTYRTRVSTAGPEAPRFLGNPPATAVYWSDGETYIVNRSTDETEGFREFVPPDRFVGSWEYWAHAIPFGGRLGSHPTTYFRRVFDEVPTRFVERTTGRGPTRYRVANDGERPSPGSSLGLVDIGNARDVRLDTTIDENGVIRTFDITFRGDAAGEPVEITRTLRYDSVGSTVVEDPRS